MNFYDAIASRYDEKYAKRGEDSDASLRRLIDELHRANITRGAVMSLGIGTGRESKMLSDAGYEVHGLDDSCEMASRAIRIGLTLVSIGDFNDDFTMRAVLTHAEYVAVIMLHGTICHVHGHKRISALARHVNRGLVRGGMFYSEYPTKEWMRVSLLDADPSLRIMRTLRTSSLIVRDINSGKKTKLRRPMDSTMTDAFGGAFSTSIVPMGEWENVFTAVKQ